LYGSDHFSKTLAALRVPIECYSHIQGQFLNDRAKWRRCRTIAAAKWER
jgi:hypothetical protein